MIIENDNSNFLFNDFYNYKNMIIMMKNMIIYVK